MNINFIKKVYESDPITLILMVIEAHDKDFKVSTHLQIYCEK